MLTKLESLNYSFRNPKSIIWVIYRKKQLRNYKRNHGVLRGPQLGKQSWRARLGILRVTEEERHSDISGFRTGVVEVFILMGCYAV